MIAFWYEFGSAFPLLLLMLIVTRNVQSTIGLAIIIFMAQLPAFQYCTSEPLFIDCTVTERQWLTFSAQPLELSLVLIHVAMCMAIMKFFPKIPKIGKWIPASLVGLLVGTLVEWTLFRMVIGQGTRTVS